ncbi:MAG: DNA translocase FtsK 4TM domain-containing protein, partial [Pseudomonadota bacterium]|nr:DNA translocase FtsK 4TM domain-containing protein [Pseudomonadota bacterium]
MAFDRSLDRLEFLSDNLRGAVRRRLGELVGLALIVLSITAAVALASWSVQDPSFSHAINAPMRNLLGRPGAIASDLLIQLFGLAASLLVLPVAIGGWRLVTHRPLDREWLRLLFWLGGLVFAAAFAACLPKSFSWPLPTGLGGVTGDALLRLPAALLGPLSGWNRLGLAGITGIAALVMVAGAAGWGWRRSSLADDIHREAQQFAAEDEQASISLGWLAHALLSLKARIFRLLRRAPGLPYRGRVPMERDEFDQRFGDEDLASEEDIAEAEPRAARKPRAQPAPRRSGGGFVLPPLNLLAAARASERFTPNADEIEETAESLESVLEDFGVKGEIINARPGPVVTLYELEPAPGIKSSRVIGLADDIARSMSAVSARVAVVPGRNAIGIELPNEMREKVY